MIVGLGNPGNDYEYTRHNLGFLVVRYLAQQLKFKFAISSLTNGLTAEGMHEEKEVFLLMPMTYMNNSGVAVEQVLNKKRLQPKDVLVVCDDFHLGFGQLRLRTKGSDGGHNGLSSVIEHLGTHQFARLRMGIGIPSRGKQSVDFVLEQFGKKEKKLLGTFVEEAAACCLAWLVDGAPKAMDKFNGKSSEG